MDSLTFKFSTLTPLWTGDAQRRSDRVRETGLLGSLRWWYEGLVRGLGGVACDLSAGGCIFDGEIYERALASGQDIAAATVQAGLCPVCRLFGATGWRRRFRLEVSGLKTQPLFFRASPHVYQAAGNWLWRMFGGYDTGGSKTGRGADTRFTFGSGVLWADEAKLRIIATAPGDDATLYRLAFLLEIVSRYGGLGAKTQNGFGLIKILDGLTKDLLVEGRKLVCQDIAQEDGYSQKKSGALRDETLFNMRSFISRTYELINAERYIQTLRPIGLPSQDSAGRYVPCAFDIRYKSLQRNPFSGLGQDFGLYPYFQERIGRKVAKRLFGGIDDEGKRTAGHIRVSHLYKEQATNQWRVKIWCEVPPGIWRGIDNYPALEEIKQVIDEFIGGRQGMFPGSKLLTEYDFKPEEFFA